jgi:hypothetical protein
LQLQIKSKFEARAWLAEMSLKARIPVKQTAKTALIADELNLAFSPHHRVKLYTRSLPQRLKFPLIGMWECQISSYGKPGGLNESMQRQETFVPLRLPPQTNTM